MSTTIIIVFFLGFVLAIVISQKFKINAGFLAIGFGFILNWACGGSTSGYIKQFPITMFWNYGIPIIFYGFATANGTLQAMGKNVAYRFKDVKWAMPIAVFLMNAIIGACGAGTSSTIIVAPIAWGLCLQCGIHPYLVPLSIWCGSMIGSFLPWTSTGSLNLGAWGTFLTTISPMGMFWKDYAYKVFYGIVPFVVMFVALKGWKVKEGEEFIMEKPAPFNKEQRITMTTIICCILVLLIPSIINIFAANPVTKWMASNFSLPATAAIGISVLALARAADIRDVLKNHVAWNLLWVITGMGMYCTLSTSLGVVDAIGNMLAGVSGTVVLVAMCALSAALSFVTSAATIGPMLTAMCPALAIATGLPEATICLASCMGSGVTSISPFSTGGASSLIGCPDELADKMTRYGIIMAVVFAIVAIIFCVTGLIRLI